KRKIGISKQEEDDDQQDGLRLWPFGQSTTSPLPLGMSTRIRSCMQHGSHFNENIRRGERRRSGPS
ncbi:hypothetical protein FRC17_003622, partial [Serendipita sp. 399]